MPAGQTESEELLAPREGVASLVVQRKPYLSKRQRKVILGSSLSLAALLTLAAVLVQTGVWGAPESATKGLAVEEVEAKAAMPAAVVPATKPGAAVPAQAEVAQPAAQPAAKPAAQPAAQPVAKPAAQPAVEPVAKPAAQLAVEPVAKPAAQPAAEPAAAAPAKPAAKPAAATPYDCAAGFANFEAGWSPQKKTWCCQSVGKACPASSVAFDCAAGFVNWQAGWSAQKKHFCCTSVGKACAAAPQPVASGGGMTQIVAQPQAPTYLVPPGTRVVNGYMLVGQPGHQHWVVAPTAAPATTLPPCHTAEKGSTCYSGVVWAKYTGINLHPSWFPGLSVNSTFEEFQKALAAKGEKDCTVPCDTNTNLTNKLPWGKPSFFCWSVARPGYEMEILKTQIDHGAGIFACEEQAIFSQTKMTVGGWPPVDTIFISNVKTGVSQDGTSANSAIFQQAWHVVKSDARYNNHDFTVKADPDAIIFPWRLRSALGSHVGGNVFVRNCNKVPGSPNFPMMFGSVEILSKAAVNAYLANEAKCKTLPWQGWGEDFFLTKCLEMIGVQPVDDFGIVRDGACNGLWCGDKSASAFHPLKSVDAWMKCHDEAQ